jgi:organic radical activating enzyme
MQKDFLKEVLKFTHSRQDKNYLETNGTLPEALEEVIDDVDIVAMDLKLPSSTLQNDYWQAHREFLRIAGQKEVFVKAVICRTTTEEDLNLAIRLMRKSKALLVLQPNSREDQDTLKPKLKAFKQQCLKHNLNVCIIPQMHKVLGVK